MSEYRKVRSIDCGFCPRTLMFDRSDRLAIDSREKHAPLVADWAQGTLRAVPSEFGLRVRTVSVADGDFAFVAFIGGEIVRISPSDLSGTPLLLHPSESVEDYLDSEPTLTPQGLLILSMCDDTVVFSPTDGCRLRVLDGPLMDWRLVHSSEMSSMANSSLFACRNPDGLGMTGIRFFLSRARGLLPIGPSFLCLGEWFAFAFSPELRSMATVATFGDKVYLSAYEFPSFELQRYSTIRLKEERIHDGFVPQIGYASTGSSFFVSSHLGGVLRIGLDSNDCESIPLTSDSRVTAIASHPIRSLLAVGFENGVVDILEYEADRSPEPQEASARLQTFRYACNGNELRRSPSEHHAIWPYTRWIQDRD